MILKNFTSFRILFGRIVKVLPFPHNLGAGAGKVWGFEEFFPEFPQTSRKVFVLLFSLKKKIIKTFIEMTSKEKVLMWFCKRWEPFFTNQTRLGAIFARIFRDFVQLFNKSKLLGVRLHPLHPASYTTASQWLSLATSGGIMRFFGHCPVSVWRQW